MPEIKMTIPDQSLASIAPTPAEASAELRMLAVKQASGIKQVPFFGLLPPFSG